METSANKMEEVLEVLLRERRLQLWNAIQELYSIPEEKKAAIHRWIENNCNYVPKITKHPVARVVPHANT